MQRLLNPSEAAKISERLHDNALLQVCRKVWPGRQEEITSVMVRAEDVFFEVAWLIDELIDVESDIDIKSMISGLWSTVFNDIGYWASNVSKPDRYLIASTVFRIAATAFSLHWQSYYCDTLRDALLMVTDERRPAPEDLHAQQQQERQQQELLEAVIPCSGMLNDWVNDYIDNPDSWLTDEIDNALNPPQNIKIGKTEGRKVDKKVFDADTFRDTFKYFPKDMSQEERTIRLKMAYKRMCGVLISRDTHYDTFEAMFGGKPLDVKIVWIGTNSQLRKLFSLLVTKNKLVNKPVGGLNKILTARFKHVDGTSFTAEEIRNAGNDGDMSAVEDVVEYLTPKPVTIEDLEQQLSRLRTEEQETAKGKKNGRFQTSMPKGTNVSNTPNQHTRVSKKKQ
jgi:hypothetical protein